MKTGKNSSFIEDLIAARREIGTIKKDTKGFNYKYAKIEHLIKAIEEPLFSHGFMVTQELVSKEDGCDYLRTSLLHVSKEKLESDVRIPQSVPQQNQRINQLQSFGSAITYLRRYSLLALLFLSTEDDDGSSFQGGKEIKKEKIEYLNESHIREIIRELQGRDDIGFKILNHYNVNAYGFIPASEYNRIISTIRGILLKEKQAETTQKNA
jgi:hypothetical protein